MPPADGREGGEEDSGGKRGENPDPTASANLYSATGMGGVVEQGRGNTFVLRLKRLGLAIAVALVSVNVWTGSPLLALWVGSQTASSTAPSMTAVAVVIVTLALTSVLLMLLLARLSATYDELTGRPMPQRRTSPWLRSMRGEREQESRQRAGISGVERIVVISVVAAVIAFEIWFFFFAGSSLPNA